MPTAWGFLGSSRGLTPNLDALAKQCAVFTRAYAQEPLTTPSHAALLTGTYPQFNHVADLGAPLAEDLPYLPDILRRRGYHTAAFVGAYILDPKSHTAPGFDRGFDTYDAGFHKRRAGEYRYSSVERRAEDVVKHALAWLNKHPQGPFFLWLHFYDPHDPYDPPEPFKSRFASAPYDGEIAYTDSVLGKFFATLKTRGLYQGTLIAIAADHGEAFGEHGEQNLPLRRDHSCASALQAAWRPIRGTEGRKPRCPGGRGPDRLALGRPSSTRGYAGPITGGSHKGANRYE